MTEGAHSYRDFYRRNRCCLWLFFGWDRLALLNEHAKVSRDRVFGMRDRLLVSLTLGIATSKGRDFSPETALVRGMNHDAVRVFGRALATNADVQSLGAALHI